VSVTDVSRTLRLGRSDAAKLLSRWQSQGWLRRLRRGIYAPVPITALGQDQVLEDRDWAQVPLRAWDERIAAVFHGGRGLIV
jgi:predicted transcriptional regulator of viral defense system